MIGHGANEKGHDGIQLWITKTRPLHKDGPLITKSNLAIVDSSPSMLIVKLTTSTWRCLLVAGRAPHSGRGEHEVALFWKQVSTRVRQYERDFPILFLGDTNGHLGQFSSEAVGSVAPATENLAGHYFHDWMLEHRLFAPSTLSQYHEGPEHHTFVTPDGDHTARIDYIALPAGLIYTKIHTKVEHSIDVSTHRPDHFHLLCTIQFDQVCRVGQRRVQPKPRLNLEECAMNMQSESDYYHQLLRGHLQTPNWHLDPHASADLLAQQTNEAIHAIAPTTRKWRRKHHLEDETWHLVEQKKRAFR